MYRQMHSVSILKCYLSYVGFMLCFPFKILFHCHVGFSSCMLMAMFKQSPNKRQMGCFQCFLCELVLVLASDCLCACVSRHRIRIFSFAKYCKMAGWLVGFQMRWGGCWSPRLEGSVSWWVLVCGRSGGFLQGAPVLWPRFRVKLVKPIPLMLLTMT